MADIEYDLSELMKGSDEAVKAVMRGIKLGVTYSSIAIKRDAVALCPVDTGRLRGSIAREIRKTEGGFECVVGTTVEYAPYVEFGTGVRGAESNIVINDEAPVQHSSGIKGQFAQPFLRPALYRHQKKASDTIMECIQEELSKLQ